MLKLDLNTIELPVMKIERFVEVTEEAVLNGALVEWFRREGFLAYPAYDFNTKELVGIRYNPPLLGHLSSSAPIGDYVAIASNGAVSRVPADLMKKRLAEIDEFKKWKASQED